MVRSDIRPTPRAVALLFHARGLVCAALVVTLVAGVLNGAQSYFYCPIMDRSALTTCCAHDDDTRAAGDAAPQVSSECCESRAFGTLLPGVEVRRPSELSAPLAAFLAPVGHAVPEPVARPPEATRFVAGAGPPPPAALRARLQVYLC